MSYLKMRKKIDYLKKKSNSIDYPENVFDKKPWTFAYLNELYEKSVNGARSPRSLKHLKNVCNTLYGTRSAIILLLTSAAVICMAIFGKK